MRLYTWASDRSPSLIQPSTTSGPCLTISLHNNPQFHLLCIISTIDLGSLLWRQSLHVFHYLPGHGTYLEFLAQAGIETNRGTRDMSKGRSKGCLVRCHKFPNQRYSNRHQIQLFISVDLPNGLVPSTLMAAHGHLRDCPQRPANPGRHALIPATERNVHGCCQRRPVVPSTSPPLLNSMDLMPPLPRHIPAP